MTTTADPIDLLLDEQTHDLVIDTDAHFSYGQRATAQGVKVAVKMVEGEWFADLDEGIPYWERDGVTAARAILGQKFNAAKTEAAFREEIVKVPTVDSISSVSTSFVPNTRGLVVSWVVKSIFGDTITDSLAVGK